MKPELGGACACAAIAASQGRENVVTRGLVRVARTLLKEELLDGAVIHL